MARHKSSGWEQFYQNTDVAGSPDTTLIATAGGFPLGTYNTTNAIDLWAVAGAGNRLDADWLEFIFSIGQAGGDADGKDAVFELYASNGISGPRQVILTAALVGGTAQVVAGSDTATWADTATITDYRGSSSAANDSGVSHKAIENDTAGNNVASVTVPVLGLRYWEGLFTGAGSTSIITTAYYRWFTK